MYFATRRTLRRLDRGGNIGVISIEFSACHLYNQNNNKIRRHEVYIPITRVDCYSHKNVTHNEWTWVYSQNTILIADAMCRKTATA